MKNKLLTISTLIILTILNSACGSGSQSSDAARIAQDKATTEALAQHAAYDKATTEALARRAAHDKATLEALASGLAKESRQVPEPTVQPTTLPGPTEVLPPTAPATPIEVAEPPAALTLVGAEDGFASFMFWLGYPTEDVTVKEFDTSAIPRNSPVLVSIAAFTGSSYHPDVEFNSTQREGLIDFIRNGGKAILFGDWGVGSERVSLDTIGIGRGGPNDEGCGSGRYSRAPISSESFDDYVGLMEGVYEIDAELTCFPTYVPSPDYEPLLTLVDRPDRIVIARKRMGDGAILIIGLDGWKLYRAWEAGREDTPRFLTNLKEKVLDPFIYEY